MPVTPFHVGPGLLAKALAPRHVSLTAFVLANVAIDAEVVVRVVLGEAWLHAHLHTLWGAVAAGLASGGLVAAVGRWRALDGAETALGPALVGGSLGGLEQTALDAIMHGDLLPFWPLAAANPLLGAVGLRDLHLACVAAGVLGGGVWIARRRATLRTADR